MSGPLFQIVPERTLGPCSQTLLPFSLASGCSARPGALSPAGEADGIWESETEREREFRISRPRGAGGQSHGRPSLLGDKWKIQMAQKAFDQPRQDTGHFVHLGHSPEAASVWPGAQSLGQGWIFSGDRGKGMTVPCLSPSPSFTLGHPSGSVWSLRPCFCGV